jgi:hypothetical protein
VSICGAGRDRRHRGDRRRVEQDGGPAGAARRGDGGFDVVLVADRVHGVRKSPEVRNDIAVQHADIQRLPGVGALRRQGVCEPRRRRILQQPGALAVGEHVRGAGVAGDRQLVECLGQATADLVHGHAAGGLLGQLDRRPARDDPVDGVHLRAEGGGVDEERQAEVPRAGPVPGCVPVGLALQIGGIAVVAVRDQRLAPVQVGGDLGQLVVVGQRPQPVPQSVRQDRVDERRLRVGGGNSPAGRAAAVVHEEDRFEVGVDRGVQGEPVADRPGHRVLVRQHDVVLGRRQRQGPQQTALGMPAGRVRLLVDVQRGRLVRAQHALGAPPLQRLPGPLVPVDGRVAPVAGVPAGVAWEDETHDVVIVRRLERGHPVGVDDVVRRGGQRGQVAGGPGVVPQGAEGRQHEPVRGRHGGGRERRASRARAPARGCGIGDCGHVRTLEVRRRRRRPPVVEDDEEECARGEQQV